MTVPIHPHSKLESSPENIGPNTPLTREEYEEAIERAQTDQLVAARNRDHDDLNAAQGAESLLQAGRVSAARAELRKAYLDAESPAKKTLRDNLLQLQPPKEGRETKDQAALRAKAREGLAYDAVHDHFRNVASALREKGFSPDRAPFKYARTYIAQTSRLVPSKSAPSILELGWRDKGTPNDDSKPSLADKFRNWIERRSNAPAEPIEKTVWLTDTKGQLGSSNPMSRTHDMVRGCGFDANGDIFIIDSANVPDRSKAAEGSGNRLRSVVDPYTYIVDHGFDASVMSIPSAFSMMRSHVEGVAAPGDDAEGKGYLAFYDHFVARANSLYEGLTGESFQGMSSTEPTVGEAAIDASPSSGPTAP